MPVAKTVTLAQAKAVQQQTAQAKETQPSTTQNTTQNHIPDTGKKVEPTEEQLQEEEKRTLALLEAQDNEEDPDEKAAREAKEKQAARKAKTKTEKRAELPSVRSRKRVSKGTKPRPCERCKTTITPTDGRVKYCMPCANIVKKEAAQAGAGRPPAEQDVYQEKLRPFLRLGLNLKEACLEAEVGYWTVIEKTKIWPWFAEFIERHQNYAIVKAKRNIFTNLGANDKETVATSKWLLERRRPNEYGPKVDITGSLNHVEQLSPEKQAILAALIAKRKWKQTPPQP